MRAILLQLARLADTQAIILSRVSPQVKLRDYKVLDGDVGEIFFLELGRPLIHVRYCQAV